MAVFYLGCPEITRRVLRLGEIVRPKYRVANDALIDTTMPNDFDIQYVAHLARLTLTAEEEQKLGAQLAGILGYIEKLKEPDVSRVEPTAHAVPLINVFRPDEIRSSLSNEEALRNAPAKANGLFLVPKIVE